MTLTQEIFFQIWKLLPNMVVPQTGEGTKAAHANQESIGRIEHHKGNVRPGNRTTCVRVSGAFYAMMVTQYLQRVALSLHHLPLRPTPHKRSIMQFYVLHSSQSILTSWPLYPLAISENPRPFISTGFIHS